MPGTPVDLTLPPELALTLGYRGDARFAGFYWSSLGDQLVTTDGVDSGSGEGWAFLTFKRHRAVAPLLVAFEFGSSDAEAVHLLLIDREENRAAVAPAAEARDFLARQHPPAPELSPEQQVAFRLEMDRLLEEWRQRPVDHEAISRAIAERQKSVARMVSFLDALLAPES